jgi:hypothetical protein
VREELLKKLVRDYLPKLDSMIIYSGEGRIAAFEYEQDQSRMNTLLDAKINLARQTVVDVIEDDFATRLKEIRAEHDLKLHGSCSYKFKTKDERALYVVVIVCVLR